MSSSSNKAGPFPLWFRIVLCGSPAVALVFVAFGSALGAPVSAISLLVLASLLWSVIKGVCRLESSQNVTAINNRGIVGKSESSVNERLERSEKRFVE